MAETKMIPVGSDFQLEEMTEKLIKTYQTRGFETTKTQMGEVISIKFSKDVEGIKRFLGLALEITASFSLGNNAVMINFSDAEWTGKIIAGIAGWFLCWIPCGTAAYGAVKQYEFPKTIAKDVQTLANGNNIPLN